MDALEFCRAKVYKMICSVWAGSAGGGKGQYIGLETSSNLRLGADSGKIPRGQKDNAEA
jgi:hypothetical protein